jgi:hypothetical protein
MKRGFFLISIVFCIYSCTLEEEAGYAGYYSDSFGVVRLFGDGTPYIESDEEEILIPNQNIFDWVEVDDRVWVSYTVEKANEKRDTLTIEPYRITCVMPLNLQSETTLNDNGIDLWTVWIAQGFLTFDFRIKAKDPEKIKEHEYALVSSQKEIVDTLFINFKHDDKGDNYGVLCRTAVALKLSDLRIASDSVVIAIDYKNINDGVTKTEYRIYKTIQN